MQFFLSLSIFITCTYYSFQIYLVPEWNIFEDKYNNARVIGSCILLFVSAAVFTGVKFVSRLAFLVLMSVIIAIASVFLGMFLADGSGKK